VRVDGQLEDSPAGGRHALDDTERGQAVGGSDGFRVCVLSGLCVLHLMVTSESDLESADTIGRVATIGSRSSSALITLLGSRAGAAVSRLIALQMEGSVG
jgi:hypothetical protein